MCQANNQNRCYFCGSVVNAQQLQELELPSNLLYYVVDCPVCGKYLVDMDYKHYFKEFRNEISFYLYFYNRLEIDEKHHKICIIKDSSNNKDKELLINMGFEVIDIKNIKEKYPGKTIKKYDLFSYALVKKAGKLNKISNITIEEIASAASIQRNYNNNGFDYEDALNQIKQPLYYWKNKGFISNKNFVIKSNKIIEDIYITAECNIYVENLKFNDNEKQNLTNNIFIAIEFSENTEQIIENLKSAIEQAGYNPIVMKDLIFSEQIVPEIYKNITNSKMLVMDATYPNCGAYYEAGFAQGQNKKVIVTCNKEKFNKEGIHFDISQKQCLLWEDEEDLTKTLTEWIKALA